MTLRLTALLALVPALATAQSMGDAARREKERRKQLEAQGVKPVTLDERDLRSGKGQLANDPSLPPAAKAEAGAKAPAVASREKENDTGARDAVRNEAFWRDRFAHATARVEFMRKQYDYLNGLVLSGNEFYVNEKNQKVITSLEHLRSLVAQAKAALETAEKALEDLRETARRENVPPGWLR